MRGIRYFLSRLKGHIKSSPAVIAISLVTAAAIALLAVAALRNMTSKEDDGKIFSVGIVGDMNQRYLSLVVDTLNNLDDSRFSISFDVMEEDEARSALRSGDVLGYLVIPDGFIEAAARGEFIPATYVSEGTDTALGDTLISEFIKVVESLADETQKGVFGAENYIMDQGVKWRDVDPYSDGWTLKYAEYLLARNETLDIEYIGDDDRDSTVGYYFSAFALFFAMLFGIACAAHLVKSDYSLPKLLKSRRLGAARQIIAEFAAYFIFSFVFLAVIVTLAGVVLSDSSVSGIAGEKSIGDFALYALSLAPASAMIAAAAIMMYEIVDGVVGGVLLLFTTSIVTAYISGYFYPSTFFPESVQKIAAVLPGGVALKYARSLYSGSDSSSYILPLLLYAAAFVALSAVIRRVKTGGDNA